MAVAVMLSFLSRQQALLAAISEKDANIALLELSASNKKKTQDEVLALKRERDKLMHQLKQHVRTVSQIMSAQSHYLFSTFHLQEVAHTSFHFSVTL